MNARHASDVAAASAAYAWTLVEGIAKLPPSEGFERLYDLFHTALLAYLECHKDWRPVTELRDK